MAEIERRPALGQFIAGCADVANEGAPLAHLGLDRDRQAQALGDNFRGLQGPCIGAGENPVQRILAELRHRVAGLAMAALGQLGILDARVDAADTVDLVDWTRRHGCRQGRR